MLTSGAIGHDHVNKWSHQAIQNTLLHCRGGSKRGLDQQWVLNTHVDIVDSLSLIEVAERFIAVHYKKTLIRFLSDLVFKETFKSKFLFSKTFGININISLRPSLIAPRGPCNNSLVTITIV